MFIRRKHYIVYVPILAQPTSLHTAYNLKTNDRAMPYFNLISEVQRRGMHFFGVNITTCVDFRNKE